LKLAARVALGAGAAGVRDADEDAAGVLEILAANKVPLVSLTLEEEGEIPFSRSSPGFADAFAIEKTLREASLRAYREVAGALAVEGIRPVLFKSPHWYPYLSSNLDVLVSPDRFDESARIIEELGHIRFPHYHEDHKLLFRTFVRGEPALSVHLHEAVSWGRVVIVEGERVVARSLPGEEGDLFVASPDDALAGTLAHTIIETDQVRLSDLRIVRWCLARGASVEKLLADAREHRWEAAAASALSLYDAVARACGGGELLSAGDRRIVAARLRDSSWAHGLLEGALPHGAMRMPHRLGRSFSKRHLVRLILEDDRREPETKVLDLIASAWNLLANRTGVRCRPARLITVSGPDGAGKSRLADSLVRTFRLCEIPTARLWSRGGFSGPASSMKALARRIAPGAVPGAKDESAKRGFMKTGWRRSLWVWAVVIEQAVALQRLRIRLFLGRSVICDRYVYDTLADILARLPALERKTPARAAGFLMGSVPAPDLAFLILVDPDVAHARKGDGTSVGARRDLAAAYGSLRGASPFQELDGALPFGEMAQSAVVSAVSEAFGAFERRGA